MEFYEFIGSAQFLAGFLVGMLIMLLIAIGVYSLK